MTDFSDPEDVCHSAIVTEAIERHIIQIENTSVTYHLNRKKSYDWTDPEEWVRAFTIAFLIVERDYPANRVSTEVQVPRRTPSDWADIVVYEDDGCRRPYLVVENKSEGQSRTGEEQGIEQLFGNANSLRAPLGLYDEGTESVVFDIDNYDSMERVNNQIGRRIAIPRQYNALPNYVYFARLDGYADIQSADKVSIEDRVRRAHSAIWAGGRRDPLMAFDEWSKVLFAKVDDERNTPSGEPRGFQVGRNETVASVANKIHRLFTKAIKNDPEIFPEGSRIRLPDAKITEVVKILEDISFLATDVDSIGAAFERFFGSVFRGELGQYFTMRQLSRFTVAMLDVKDSDYVLDPTAGSGGFLLEALLQVWERIANDYDGLSEGELERKRIDFAYGHVYGIEIHEILGRICKINLLLHHDGHTNIESGRSCLDSEFDKGGLRGPAGRFDRVVGNPPFGDNVRSGDEDHLGANSLDSFEIAHGLRKVPSEHVIVERSINFLEPGKTFGLVLPDGMLNNQGERSNCPRARRFMAKRGKLEAVISLPDHAFHKSGAQNKTSLVFFRKFTKEEAREFDKVYRRAIEQGEEESGAIGYALDRLDYWTFVAEPRFIGYNPAGYMVPDNDLYRAGEDRTVAARQEGTVLGEYWRFLREGPSYSGITSPDCTAQRAVDLWNAHPSHRLDAKYHLFKQEEARVAPQQWEMRPVGEVLRRREEVVYPELEPNRRFSVMTVSKEGYITEREAGKGKNPPEWLGMYFEDGSSTWYRARAGDVVFSSIDLWKGCIAVVPDDFDGALVTKEFPIYRVMDEDLDPEFLSYLLRTRFYQRAFRAITTGHSNRRRTQVGDFESLEIVFPRERDKQAELIKDIRGARRSLSEANARMVRAYEELSDIVDGRTGEGLFEVGGEGDEPDQ